MKKILMISHSSSYSGGSQDNYQRLMEYLSSYFLIYSVFPKGDRFNKFIQISEKYLIVKDYIFPIYGFSCRKYLKLLIISILNNIKLTKFLYSNRDIDACFVNSSVSFYFLLSLRIFNIPSTIYIREKINPGVSRKWIYRFINKTAKTVIANSNFTREIYLRGLKKQKAEVKVVYSTIDEKAFENITSKKNSAEFKILNVASVINPNKNLLVLLEAIRILKNESDIRAEFVGYVDDHSYMEKLMDFCATNNILEKITFSGGLKKEDIKLRLKDADVVVITSKEEGFSLVLLEGMYSSKPIITTNVGVIPEVIINKVNGLIYNYNDFTILAKYIKMLKDNKELRTTLAENSYKTYLNNFSTIKSFDSLRFILANLMSNPD